MNPSGLLRQGAGLNAKCALILAEKDNYPIAWMCRQLGVARSSFYAWRARAGTVTATQALRDALRPEIQRVFTFLRGAGGCRRVAAKLNEEGIICSVGLVADLMREMGLAAILPRAYKRTTIPDAQAQIFEDHPDRNFDPDAYTPGQALVSDIIYLKTGEGWLYFATIIALATRMWSSAGNWPSICAPAWSSMPSTWHASTTESPRAPYSISIMATQYTSQEFTAYCTEAGIVQSMGRTGVAWDNAVAETFFASLKNEMYHQQVFSTRPRARMAVAKYIEVFYNRQRPHSSLGYRTPAQAWSDHEHLDATASAQAA